MQTLRITSRGRITIPAELRKKYRIKPGTLAETKRTARADCHQETEAILASSPYLVAHHAQGFAISTDDLFRLRRFPLG
jgi:hypothetical protein